MILGKVMGSIWATQKEDGMSQLKLLIIEPINWKGEPAGAPIIAADRIGAGRGERVIVSRGSPARTIFSKNAPIDAVVVGIVDSLEVGEGEE
ncbi:MULTISPECIES: EutN/CcmL family microcompartment protein [Neobacillus]|uniref:EutN/CcmL family microcompartment protein n=1 Tax=Neobacillus citreus TaxID=2833578 RepID=A0A942TBE9_9BACI|nr:EutN/CcmL family microcompartment protein [Neobacillus citreus]MCH6266917.1 EutN/CcmL family microcompartment protein [Neobacillus citreus]